MSNRRKGESLTSAEVSIKSGSALTAVSLFFPPLCIECIAVFLDKFCQTTAR